MTTREYMEWAIACQPLSPHFWISERMEREAADFAAKIALNDRVAIFVERNG